MSNKEESTEPFVRPEVICDALDKCLTLALVTSEDNKDSDDNLDGSDVILMDEYLRAYKELAKFFHSLGVIFSFVAKDVDSKIHILETYRSDELSGHHYKTFQSMIKYEESENLLKDPKRPSGSRTVLRLHRALQFFSLFMEELAEVSGSTASGPIAREVYKKTLAPYHSWVIQKSASFAMYKLPTRDSLIDRAFGHVDHHNDRRTSSNQINEHEDGEKKEGSECSSSDSTNSSSEWKKQSEEMRRLGNLSRQVYDAAQSLFQENNLLDLP